MGDRREAETGSGSQLDLSEFVRRASHDLANAFNAVALDAELAKLLLERNQTAKLGDTMDRVIAGCMQCGRLIQGMQRFACGIGPGPRENVAVRKLVDEAIELAALDAPRAQRIGDIDARVAIDVAAFQRAIAEMLRNAAEAGAGAVEVRLRKDDGDIAIGISDDGAGIPENLRERVQEAFFTTRRGDGHIGLGLTMARELADGHGGTLTIGDSKAGGALVELRLPIASTADA